MSKRKKRFVTIALPSPVEVVNRETGEVYTVSQFIVPVGDKDSDFCKVYNRYISKISDLSRSERKVFDWCIANMDYENKVLILNLRKLALELRLAYGTVRNAISKLIKKGFLKKLENGLYLVNPAIACKTSVSKKDGILIQFVKEEEYEEFIAKVSSSFKQNDSKRKKE